MIKVISDNARKTNHMTELTDIPRGARSDENVEGFFSSFEGFEGFFSSFFLLTFFLVRDYWKLQYNNRLWMVQIQESHFVAGHFHKAQWNVLSMNIKCKFPESNLWRSVKRYSTLGAFFFSDQLQKQR